jgi:hypothetical protein
MTEERETEPVEPSPPEDEEPVREIRVGDQGTAEEG